jgi:hypothetical protein
VAAKTFDEFWKHDSGWYDPNEPQGLSEYVLAQSAWIAATKAAEDKIVELYASWHIAHKDVDATLVEEFVDWVQERMI